jgi:uncharacterized protein
VSFPEFSIPARELDAAGKRFRFAVRAAWLRHALEDTDVAASGPDGELDLRVSKSGPDVVVRGSLAAELEVPCARCLGPARVTVREELSALAVPAAVAREAFAGAGDDDAELAAEHADVISFDGETLLLDDFVRGELLLGIPMIPLCSEGCPGIRPEPAIAPARPDLDPRLYPLLGLKKKT